MRLTIPQHQLTLSGNTAGALSNLSSGTVTLAGGNNITLSQAGNAITISGANAGGAQTGISGIANSETTYTSGTVSLSESGALTIRSSTGQHFQFEVPQTSSLSATGAVSISVNGSTISIGAPAQSTQVETQTFIAGVSASDTLYTSGNVRITGVGGGVTVSSNTGQRVDISVAAPVAQSVQTQNMVAVTLSGNTSGAQALISSGTMTLAGGNNITVSQAGNAVTISGPNVGGAQTAISGLANSETTYTSGTVSLSELGAITIRSTTGNQFQFSVNPQSTQVETQTFIAGISASDTLYTSGNVRITGVGGGVTVSSNTGQRVDISVAAQSVQPETQTFIAGVSASDTLYTSGNVRFTGVGGGITVSSNTGQRVDLSVAAQSVQPETQTFIGGISASNTLYTSGSVRFTGSQAVTVRSGTGQLVVIDAPAQTTQVETQTFLAGAAASNTTYTSGTFTITGVGGGITVSSNTGQRIDLSVAAPVAQTNQAGSVYAISNTSGTSSGTYDARTLSIAGAGMITVAASNSGWRINASQSVQTQSLIQALYDGANSITTGTVRVTDANGVTFSINAQTLSASVNQSISMFAVSNTTQSTSGTAHKSALSFAGAGAASVGVTGGSVVVSVAAGAGQFSGGASNLGNTAGATGITGTQLVLVGSNNITLSQTTGANGGTVSIIGGGGGGFSAGMSTEGNTAGNTGVTGTRLVFVGSGPISLSQTTGAAGGTLSINAPATSSLSATGDVSISTNGSTISIGVPPLTAANWENMAAMQAVLYTHISGVSKTPFYWPEMVPGIKPANIALRVSMVTASADLSVSVHFGVYTFVNSTSAALLGSASDAFVVSSASSVSFSAQRNLILTSPGTHTALSSLSAGNYLFGAMFSASATGAMNASLYAATAAAGPRMGRIMPGTNQLSTATSQGIAGLYGRGSTTVNAMPANVVASEVVNQGIGASSPMKPYIFIRS